MSSTRFSPSSRPVGSYHSASVCEPLPFPPPPMAMAGIPCESGMFASVELRSSRERVPRKRSTLRTISRSGESSGELSRWPRSQGIDFHPERIATRAACGGFVLHACLHRIAKSAFQSIQLGFLFRAKIDLHRRARRNRIHRSAALDHAEIVGAARIVRNLDGRKFHDAARKRGDGIRSAKIRPAVAAWAR